jgi:glucose-6-phosphate dehydrogenase assembly protein OpcA
VNGDERLESFTGGERLAVDVGAIERELAALWRQSSEGDAAVSRACLWNLVVRAPEPSFDRARSVARSVVPSVPARALFLRTRTDPGPELDSWISAICHIAPGGGKLLCSEEIVLEARGGGEAHLPALVRALLVPDVPAALWWEGDLGEDLLAMLIGDVQRLIVDSTAGASLERLASLGARAHLELVDLAWLRLGPVRGAFASFFDPPVGPEPLAEARRLSITCGAESRGAAVLFAGWLCARLVQPPPVEIRCGDGAAMGCGLQEIALDCGRYGRFAIAHAGPGLVEAQMPGRPPRVLAAPGRSEAELIVAALGSRGHDPLLRAALACRSESAGRP